MPVLYRASRDEAEGRISNGRRRDTGKHARAARPIESLAAAGTKSARRYGKGAASKRTFEQKMPAASERSHRKHRTSRTTAHKSSRVDSYHRREHRHRDRTREAEPNSEDDYVYPRETRERRKGPQTARRRYEEVRVLGRDGDDDEVDADGRQAEHHTAAERPRTSRMKSSHHRRHHDHHRAEDDRPLEYRAHRPRTEAKERERDERRRDRRAAREAEYRQELPPSTGRHEHRVETNVGWFSKFLGRRLKSVPRPPSPHRPRTRRSLSDPVLSTPRPEVRVPECDDITRQPPPEKHKSERRKEKHTSIIGGLFAPTVKEQAPVKLVTCVVCMDDDIKSTRAPKLKCGHRMCHSCLRRSFKLSIKDPQQMPPKCCTADAIPLRAVDKLFPNDWKRKWNRKYEEYTTKDRIYCPRRTCGEWIRPEDIKKVEGKRQGVCGKCKTRACGTCSAKWHGVKDCPKDPDTNALLDAARKAGWKRCYSCRMLVERKEGCNHMTCRCTAQFCMLCGLKWRTCECPWFNYETVEADRLAHIRVPGDFPRPRPPLFPPAPRANPFDAFFPPPPPPARPAQPQVPAPVMPNPPIDVFDAFEQMMNHQPFVQNFPAQENQAQQQQAAARQRQREQHRQLLRQQQQLEERQRQLRADEEVAREMARANLITTEEEAPRQRRTQSSVTSSEAPRSVQAGLGGPGRRRGSGRVDGWMEFVEPEVRTVPVR